MSKRPNFFIVGAPKSGTTSLNNYLREHPEIFIPEKKELHFFGRDLQTRNRLGHTLTLQDYLYHFEGVTDQLVIGEASVLYMTSESGAREIYEFDSSAKIIIMLRHPVEMMYSLHSQLLSQADEDIDDFEKALELELARREGRHLPKGVTVLDDAIFYRRTARYSTQIGRYKSLFPENQIHFIVFEEFRAKVDVHIREVLGFLGVMDTNFLPELRIFNANSRARFPILSRLLYHPPKIARLSAKALLPRRLLIGLVESLRRRNQRNEARKPMDFELRQKLCAEFGDEIDRVEELTSKDMSIWRDISANPGG